MRSGALRSVPLASAVPDILKLETRAWPFGGPSSSVSLVGLWSCTGTRDDVGPWFQAKVREMALVYGHDWIGKTVGDHSRVFVHVTAAYTMILPVRTRAAAAASRLIEPAVRLFQANSLTSQSDWIPSTPDDATPLGEVAPSGLIEDPADAGAPLEPDGDEPWAEAFDFGRLVPVADREIGGVLQPTVSARDVHTFLDSGRKPTTWFQEQVRRCSLAEGVDWGKSVSPNFGRNPVRGRPTEDFTLTLSAAKKVAMTASGLRGAAVREYFIECERRLLAGEGPVPGSVGVAPPAVSKPDVAASPSSVRPLQPSLPDHLVPLTMTEFFCLVGFEPENARAYSAIHGILLVRKMMLDGDGAGVGRHPVSGVTIFSRPALDSWWIDAGRDILAGVYGIE